MEETTRSPLVYHRWHTIHEKAKRFGIEQNDADTALLMPYHALLFGET